MAARVRVRPADVGEQEIVLAEMRGEPVGVDDGGKLGRHSALQERAERVG